MLKQISKNTFRLNLLLRLKIYLVISVSYLELTTSNLYNYAPVTSSIIVNKYSNKLDKFSNNTTLPLSTKKLSAPALTTLALK